ncbi:GNAT family N-acetyltransferase [Spirosoma rhododendri]|uniref:GNAT family N-acetyltransferase n=1 Tax=Spirosoma rhododendri TaxID=2728024 RepID=A0A7L5DSQ3_9BACT|nr:GNAT family N-acetyltransferase [Spirosoma rhododendri]QJD79608.1 GNAT family N-acetyltransferase [Spirosoma rhododendri]
MTNFIIEKVSLNEVDQLQTIGQQTFSETFSASNTAADMDAYLTEKFSTETLTSELNSAGSEFYFARFDGRVIAYLKLNVGQSQTEMKGEKSLEIERIYVLNAFHGQKVGQLLYEKAMQIARQLAVDYVWLGVWEHNPRAIAFYKKNGFVPFDTHVFKLGTDEQTDIMMKLTL